MQLESKKLLYDILEAARSVTRFVENKTFNDFLSDELLRAGVERKLEIIGEAMNRFRRAEPGLAESITGVHQIVALRHILIHGYDAIEYETLWEIAETKVKELEQEVSTLLKAP